MQKTYQPVGTQWVKIDELNGKPLPKFHQREFAEMFLEQARTQYSGTPVEIHAYPVEHGGCNRDGEYAGHSVTYYILVREAPRYSEKDNLEMICASVTDNLVKSMVKHRGFTEESAREHLARNGLFSKKA